MTRDGLERSISCDWVRILSYMVALGRQGTLDGLCRAKGAANYGQFP